MMYKIKKPYKDEFTGFKVWAEKEGFNPRF